MKKVFIWGGLAIAFAFLSIPTILIAAQQLK